MVFEKVEGTAEAAFVVQASKFEIPSLEMSASTEAYFSRLMVALQHVNLEAKSYGSLRLAADFSNAKTDEEKKKVVACVPKLDDIYAILKNVQDSVIPAPIKALLANLLVFKWENTPAQIEALRKGLGLEAADEYWTELGKTSSALLPKAKIQLLAEIIPACGFNARVADLPTLMATVLEILRSRFQDVEEKALQTYTAELIISDYLYSPASSVDRVVRFVKSANSDELRKALAAFIDPPIASKAAV